MNAEKYIELLTTTLIPELAAAGRPMTFMQDNAPYHTANVVKTSPRYQRFGRLTPFWS
jgi:hypothetical protein